MNVIELFSGIGGMHYSLKKAGVNCNVVAAVDINTSANEVYRHNFPTTPVYQRNIQSITSDEINKFNPDMITMSPPCQPFTRVGLKKDSCDVRTNALIHVIKLLPNLNRNLKYIILENVKGFEESNTRDMLIKALDECDFKYQEFLLNPSDYLIPSSRLRYYLIAKRKQPNFHFKCDELMKRIPLAPERLNIIHREMNQFAEIDTDRENCQFKTHSLSKILEIDKDLKEFKAYGRYAEGTGSVLCPIYAEEVANAQLTKINSMHQLNKNRLNEELADILEEMGLRYFTPREIARLMCFPEAFTWPKHFNSRQMYKLLGNSINVYIVALLIILLTENKS